MLARRDGAGCQKAAIFFLFVDSAKRLTVGAHMSLQTLEAALGQASEQIKPAQLHYASLFEDDGVTPKLFQPLWLIAPIEKEIEDTPELLELASRLSPHAVAQSLVHHLFAGLQPADIVANVVDFAGKNTCRTLRYIGLYGGGVSNQIILGEGVSVMPASQAPPSFARQWIFGIGRRGEPIFDARTSYRSTPPFRPNLALLIAQDEEIFVEPGAASAPALFSAAEKTTRAVRALTLAGGYPFVQSWQSSWLDHPAVPYEGFGGIGGTGTFDGPPQRRGDATPVDPKVAEEMFSKLKSLGSAVKIPIELATDRLRRSRAHQSPADTAMDLGIASEIILLHGVGGSELGFRLSFRGAYLLGRNPTERHTKFESFRSLYDARSKAAHSGTLSAKLLARLPEFDEICTAAIRAIVDRQEFPNWDELTLGSESS
jgi:hypothetical protein